MQADVSGSSAVTFHRHLAWIASEEVNISGDPLQSSRLIQYAEVARELGAVRTEKPL